jgi:hypothetical protein
MPNPIDKSYGNNGVIDVAIKKAYGEEWFKTLKYKTVICSGSTFGGQPAIRTYTSAMVHQFDVTNCTV